MEPVKRKCVPVREGDQVQEVDNCAWSEDGPSPLMLLPREMWTHVFNFVPQTDRIKHRGVSKKWRKNVDELSTVDVMFNEDYPLDQHREQVFGFRIRSCRFSSLHAPFLPNFKYPLLVKEITFAAHVSASNVLKILEACSMVESLRFLTTLGSETSLEVNDETIRVFNNLRNLQYLEVGILTFLDRNPKQKSRTFSAIIGNESVVFPALRTLSVAFLVCHTEWYHIFRFVSRHHLSFKSLNIIYPYGEHRPSINEEIEKKAVLPNDLVLPQLDSLVVNGGSECSCRNNIWRLLDRQKKLRRFETDISQGAMFLNEITECNQSTIKILRLHKIENLSSSDDELNCDIFERCNLLQELTLKFDWGYVVVVNVKGGTTQQRMPVLYNLGSLPKNLTKLTLCGTQILSRELESLFSKERKLEEVTLGRADYLKIEDTGMTLDILIKTLENLSNLKKFRIFLDMISESESREVVYCSELNGVWLRIWEVARELNIDNESDSEEGGERCCGERYGDETCLSHRPFMDLIFKNSGIRLQFLNRIRELHLEVDNGS